MPTTGIELKHLGKSFSAKNILEDINLQIQAGEFVSILGASGCGKSTLLRLLAGLEPPSRGNIFIAEPLKSSLSFVFQDANLLPWKTVAENVGLPLAVGTFANKYSVTEKKNLIQEALRKVHLADAADLFPHQLSGGMKMRVSLARALVTAPQLILLDEPFGALDEVTRFEMQNQLLELWQNEKVTVVFVTHSISEAAYLAQKIILLKKNAPLAQIDVPLPSPRNDAVRASLGMAHFVQELATRFRA